MLDSGRYRKEIINILIKYGFIREVERQYPLEVISENYRRTKVFMDELDECTLGNEFYVNIELMEIYKENGLSYREMAKEVFLKKDRLVNYSKSNIQRLLTKIIMFDQEKDKKEKRKYMNIEKLFNEYNTSLEKAILLNELIINQNWIGNNIFCGEMNIKTQIFVKFKIDYEKLYKLGKKGRFLSVLQSGKKETGENDRGMLLLYNYHRKGFIEGIRKSLTVEKEVKYGNEFIRLGGFSAYIKAVKSIKEESLNTITYNFNDTIDMIPRITKRMKEEIRTGTTIYKG